MKVKIKNIIYEIDPKEIDISIPIQFNSKKNPKFYDNNNPSNVFYKDANLEYNINKNGPCNVPIIKMNIHCCGTHTETANHIIQKALTINKIKNFNFLICQLVTINPESINNESYHYPIESNEKVITKKILKQKINNIDFSLIKSLIIRTTPNTHYKKKINYNKQTYPFLTTNAVLYLKDLGIRNLLIDTPSIDRFNDDGILGNHHIFFAENGISNKNTLTELVYVPNLYKDGLYLLNLGVPNFQLDAAPSRPILFKIIN